MYALVDCNSFYASCEQIFRPDLRGKPVVVLSNNDGCIVARNREAKALNIPDLQPFFKVRGLLQQHQVAVFSSNYALYGDISAKVMRVLAEFSPAIEVYSIDECFLDLAGFDCDYQSYSTQLKQALWQQLRVPVSVGVAPTKTLAKLANHLAKVSSKLNGVCVIDNPEQWQAVFAKVAVNKVWGVGRRLQQRLNELGIYSVADLQRANAGFLRSKFGVTLARTMSELQGEVCMELEPEVDKQQIVCSRSFSRKVYVQAELAQALSTYASRAGEKLRRQKSLANAMMVFIETSRYDAKPYKRREIQAFAYPSDDTRELIGLAKSSLAKIYRPGFAYLKVGVVLMDLLPRQQQLYLWPKYQQQKSAALMQTLDTLKAKDLGSISFASSGIDTSWQMRRQFKSPSYTTNLKELVQIEI